MKKQGSVRVAIVAALLVVAVALGFAAANWPTKAIALIYHSGAGSGGDLFLRALAKSAEAGLGKPIVVENKTGAGGLNAWRAAADARDNHTLLGVSSTIITAPILNNMPVTYRNFKPVAMMFQDPMILFVSADKPWKTLEDFIADAKANPGKYSIAGGVAGELGFVAGKLLEKEAGVQFSIVPFEAGSDAAVSVLGGHIDGAIGEYAEGSAQIEAGKLRVLLAFNKVPGMDYPTVMDKKLNITIEKFRGILAPKNLPDADVKIFADACRKAMDEPNFKAYYTNMRLIPNFKVGADFTKVMENQDAQIKAFTNN
ncbi:MAG TPA: tripartite tricarboxylate transporter substrate binding protein [Rectinemataceae bacterium]|nr:tripartite tricarboxylate transporter substrate binding protein [Rectinemataceae bacterium]